MKNNKHVSSNKKSLIRELAILDLKLKYRNSILGVFWSFLEPLLMLTVLYVVFTNIYSSSIKQFPLYLLLGIIMWNMVVRGTTMSVNSIVTRGGLLTQIYLPRSIFATSSTVTATIMLGFELIVFFIFMAIFQLVPPVSMLFLPIIFIMMFVLVLGLSLPLSVLNVYYRDVEFIWGIIMHAGFFTIPIFYTLDILPENIKELVLLNPIAQLIEMAHNVTLYGLFPSYQDLSYTICVISAIFLVGYIIFSKMKDRIVEEF